jgi:hypothetical protein
LAAKLGGTGTVGNDGDKSAIALRGGNDKPLFGIL